MSCIYFLISISDFQNRCLLFWCVLWARLSGTLLLSVKIISYYYFYDNFKIKFDIGISLLLILYEISFPELLEDVVQGSNYNFPEISLVFLEYSEIWWLAFKTVALFSFPTFIWTSLLIHLLAVSSKCKALTLKGVPMS